MIARGKNASDLFPAVVKNVACKNIEVRKVSGGPGGTHGRPQGLVPSLQEGFGDGLGFVGGCEVAPPSSPRR